MEYLDIPNGFCERSPFEIDTEESNVERAKEQAQSMARMEELEFSSIHSYLLKRALNGMIINIDLTDVRECWRVLHIVRNNVNQVAKRSNESGNIYATDLADVQSRLDKIW